MRIGFFTDGKLDGIERRTDLSVSEVYALSFGVIGEVDYQKEIAGITNEMEEIALFSHHFSCVTVAGCYTDTEGIKRRSAIVADHGKILGVSDSIGSWDGEAFKCGSGIRVYDTSAGKIGVLVGRDVYFSDLVKSLSQCGAEVVICVYEQLSDNVEQLLIRADAFRYGVPICLCAHGFAEVADPSGKLLYASPKRLGYSDLDCAKQYHLIQTRRRGFYHAQITY